MGHHTQTWPFTACQFNRLSAKHLLRMLQVCMHCHTIHTPETYIRDRLLQYTYPVSYFQNGSAGLVLTMGTPLALEA